VIQSSPIINEIGAQIQGDTELRQENIESPLTALDFNFLNSSDQDEKNIDYISSTVFPIDFYHNRTDFIIGDKEISWENNDSERKINLAAEASEKFDRQLEEKLEEITGVGFLQAINKDYSNYNLLSEIKTSCC